MKTSTKNTIIAGIFTIAAACIGIISFSVGGNFQNNKIESTIKQSGAISISQEESLTDIINRLTDEYISANKQINLLNQKNNNLETDNEMLQTNIDSMQNELNDVLKENEILKSQIAELQKLLDNFDENEKQNENITHTDTLNNIYKIDSSDYELIKGFSDSYGNTYSLAYKFDASKNAYAMFNLDEQYNILSGYVAASQDTGSGAVMVIEIYGDDILLKKINNITKSSDAIPLENIEIDGVKKLTINTYNTGAYNCGFVYLTDIELK